MLAGFLLGFAHDRRLMREAQADIAIRWFIGCGLDDRLPDHSSLTRIRQRRGEARFRKIFRRTVSACVDAGIAKGEVMHVDATLIRADAGWKSMVDRHAEAVASGNGDVAAEEGAAGDASLATSRRGQRPEPCLKQHTTVDDENGVVLGVAVTTGEGLRALPAQGRLPVQAEPVQDGDHRRRLSGTGCAAPCGAASAT